MLRGMPLIAPDVLAARLDDPRLRLLDVRWWLTDLARGRRDYLAGHLPGAVWVDLDTDLTGPAGPGRHSSGSFAPRERSFPLETPSGLSSAAQPWRKLRQPAVWLIQRQT